MTVMASLRSGVLLKLLEDMKLDGKVSDDGKKPVLLQIRSIIPVLEEGNLWPNRGFYLKVCDMSHSTYVCLPQDQKDMILSNKLKLGQFMYVQKLEKSDHLPLLRGVTPIPGRHQCGGTPEDIVSAENFLELFQAPEVDSIVEKAVISENMLESCSFTSKLCRRSFDTASKASPGEQKIGLICITDAEKRSLNVKNRSIGSDSDSALSSVSSTHVSKRRRWKQSESLGAEEIFDASVVKHDVKPTPARRCQSATVSPIRSVTFDSSDDNSISTRRRETGVAEKLLKGAKSKTPMKKVKNKRTSCSIYGLTGEQKASEAGISWASLPPSLVKLGKEVARQRDIALVAAVDALQEACAAERLLNCLSTFSEFHHAEGDDKKPYVHKFFHLQDDLARTRLIMQSMENISPLPTTETDLNTTSSVKEAQTIAREIKKNAKTWIKSAIAADLSPCSTPFNPITATTRPQSAGKPSTTSRSINPTARYIIRKQKNNNEQLPEWTRGSTLSAATDLANSLQDECRKIFLNHIERFLDEVERKTSSVESNDQIAVMLHKVKKVNQWLDVIVDKKATGSDQENSESEECCLVTNRMCEVLLKNVDRTAMALQKMST